MGLEVQGARREGAPVAPGTRLGSRTPSPTSRRRVWAQGTQRQNVPRDAGRLSPRPSLGRAPAHLSRERPQEHGPRSSRVAASTTAAILCLRPPLLSSLPAPPPAPRPPGAGPRRSGARFRCSERKPRPEPRSGGRAAGDWGGRPGRRPGQSRGHGAAAAGLERAGAAGPAAMAGYARRPGVTPLSRARSLVIPDGEQPGGGRRAGRGRGGGRRGGRARDPAARAGRLPTEAGAPGSGAAVQVGAGRCPLAGGAKVQVRRPRRAPAPARGEVALIVIPAPAFYERRSCLPQLDCERPHGRDLDSHFFGIRPTFMCYVPSPVLASVGDTGERPASGTRGPCTTCGSLCGSVNSPTDPAVSSERRRVPGTGNARWTAVPSH